MATIDDIRRLSDVTVEEGPAYWSSDEAAENGEDPIRRAYWVEGPGYRIMISWPPETEEEQATIDSLADKQLHKERRAAKRKADA